MTKELEALKDLCEFVNYCDEANEDVGVIEQALQRLEQIDNANPSKAVECILDIKSNYKFYAHNNQTIDYQCSVVVQSLLKVQEQEKENARAFGKDIINLNKILKQTIDEPILYASKYGNKYIVPQELFEKQCNVLSIIKEKNVNIAVLKNSPDLKYYNYHVSDWRKLTQDEFDLLKRWIK